MLRYALLRYDLALLCCVRLFCPVLCTGLVRFTFACHALQCFASPSLLCLCYAMISIAMPGDDFAFFAVFGFVFLCYALLCSALLLHAMLCNALLRPACYAFAML